MCVEMRLCLVDKEPLDEQNSVFMELGCWQAQLTLPASFRPANSFIFSKQSVKQEINPFKFQIMNRIHLDFNLQCTAKIGDH